MLSLFFTVLFIIPTAVELSQWVGIWWLWVAHFGEDKLHDSFSLGFTESATNSASTEEAVTKLRSVSDGLAIKQEPS